MASPFRSFPPQGSAFPRPREIRDSTLASPRGSPSSKPDPLFGERAGAQTGEAGNGWGAGGALWGRRIPRSPTTAPTQSLGRGPHGIDQPSRHCTGPLSSASIAPDLGKPSSMPGRGKKPEKLWESRSRFPTHLPMGEWVSSVRPADRERFRRSGPDPEGQGLLAPVGPAERLEDDLDGLTDLDRVGVDLVQGPSGPVTRFPTNRRFGSSSSPTTITL